MIIKFPSFESILLFTKEKILLVKKVLHDLSKLVKYNNIKCQIVEFGYMESKNFTSETPLRIEFTTKYDERICLFYTFLLKKVLRNWVSQNKQAVPKQANLRYYVKKFPS